MTQSCPLAQRAEYRQLRWKAPSDLFNPLQYEVARIATDTEARDFVEAHHYAGTYPAAAHRFGLYTHTGKLVGVAVFSVGTNDRTVSNVFGAQLVPWQECYELGRFVLRQAVAYNAESWFLARCHDELRRHGVRGIVSFSDPYPRRRADGTVAFTGHVGTIYQASNACYTGRGTARTVRLLPDGTVLNDRAIQKVRRQERGWQAAVSQLIGYGAPLPTAGWHPTEWLAEALPLVTRPTRHPGNHRYVFALGPRPPQILLATQPRPRQPDLARLADVAL